MKKQKSNLRLKILVVLLFLSIVAWLIYFFIPHKNVFDLAGSVLGNHPKYFSQLSGLPVGKLENEKPLIVAVMIDNHPDAYPQACLGGGGESEDVVVYEAPVEGVTTRFMQVMNAYTLIPKVGPVRSARPYYLDWLAEYGADALYMHCGGAPEALSLIKTRNIFDANEFYWGPYYWRDNARVAPHNLYTNHEKWATLINKYSKTDSQNIWSGWKFSAEAPTEIGEPTKAISIKYYPGYKITWHSLGDAQSEYYYERLMNDDPVHTICGTDFPNSTYPIISKNILVQFVQMETIDDYGRKKITTIGSGDAYVLRDGLLIRATWKKDDLASRTIFYDKNNQEIKLAPGNTWVQIVPVGTAVEITN